MAQFEPSEQWQTQQHQRILNGDVTAFAELCEQALPHLLTFVQAHFPQADTHLQESSVIDCLLNYQAHAAKFDPEQLGLFSYLRMSVRGDILNALDSQKRRDQKLLAFQDPEVQGLISQPDALSETQVLDEWLQTHTNVPRKDVIRALYRELNPADRSVLLLMLDGVRETPKFAAALGIAGLDADSQRQEVKRAKDRIKKQLQRLGNQLRTR